MKKTDSCAQKRINFYEARFVNETIDQLVSNFNALASSRGWTAERSYYSAALTRELQRRSIDLSAVSHCEAGHHAIRYVRVQYDKNLHALLPVE